MGLSKFFMRYFVWFGCLFSFSAFVSAASLFTRVDTLYYLPVKESANSKTTDSSAFKSCLSGLPSVSKSGNPPFFTDGEPPSKIDDVVVDRGGMYTSINFGERFEKNSFADGVWKYAIAFRTDSTAAAVAVKAAEAGNCELIRMLLTIKPVKQGDLDVYEDAGSYKCAFASDGTGACHYNKYDKTNPQDGSPLIDICSSEYCYQTKDPYKDLKDRTNESSQNPSGGGEIDEIRGPDSTGGSSSGSGGSSSGSGGSSSGSGGSSSGSGGSSSGSGGSSSGSGGDGDKEGTEEDGEELAKGFEFGKIDFEWSSLFTTIHKAVQGSVPDFDLSISGQCQSLDLNLNFGYFSVSERLTLHCQLFDSIKDLISGFFLMFWSFSAIRRILSA